jgi:hypothetical protein
MGMSNPQAQASTLVRTHLVHAFFPLTFGECKTESNPEALLDKWGGSVLGLSVGELSKRLGWEPDDANTLQQPVWALMEAGKGLAVTDFYPHVQRIMGIQSDGLNLCQPFVLQTPLLSRFKDLDKNRLKNRLLPLSFGLASAKRCGQASLMACIDGARLFSFRTGIAVLDLFWHYEVEEGDLSLGGVLEGNYFLSHSFHTQSNRTEIDANLLTPEVLCTIAHALLPVVPDKRFLFHPERRILYSAVELAQEVDEETLHTLTVWLSHRQTTDYRPCPEVQRESLWQPFHNLCHASAVEGGASVIFDTGQVSSFVRGFVKGPVHNLYIPLFVSSLHNHFWLINQTEWLPAHRRKAGSRAETLDLERLYEETVEFRRYFYFPLVSRISLHNTYYQHWQETLLVSERLHFLEQTARDVAELIKTRRIRWLGRISGAAGGFLLAHEILEVLSASGLPYTIPSMRIWLVTALNASPEELEPLMALVEHWEIGIFLGSVIGAVLGLWISWNFGARIKPE